MNAERTIELGKELYEYKRTHEKPVSDSERLLFDACVAMKQLQSDLDQFELALKAQRDETKILTTDLAKAKEENDELRKVFADYPDMMERLTKHSKEQTKEVERLKESLIEIGDYAYEGHRDSRVDEHSCLYKVSNMASKALGNPEKGGG